MRLKAGLSVHLAKHCTVNFICLDPNEIIVPAADLPLDAAEANNAYIHALDFSEFAKGTGRPNCLIMPIERR